MVNNEKHNQRHEIADSDSLGNLDRADGHHVRPVSGRQQHEAGVAPEDLPCARDIRDGVADRFYCVTAVGAQHELSSETVERQAEVQRHRERQPLLHDNHWDA